MEIRGTTRSDNLDEAKVTGLVLKLNRVPFLVISLICCTFAKFFYMEQTKEKGQGVRRAVDTTRHHRENRWDYRGCRLSFYLPR